jgi:hypothetical protein
MANKPAKILGNKGIYQQPVRFGRDDAGYFQEYTYQGTTKEIFNAAFSLDLAGWQYDFEELHGGISKVTAKAGWSAYSGGPPNDPPENVWELTQQDEQKNILEADFPFSNTTVLNDINLSSYINSDLNSGKTADCISKMLQDPVSQGWNDGTSTFAGSTVAYIFDDGAGGTDSDSVIHLPANDYEAAKSLYFILKRGVTSFPVEASLIRHTQIVSNVTVVQAGYFNVNRVISSSSMISLEGVPYGLLFGVPIAPSPSQFIQTPGDLLYGWRKVRPNVSRLAATKWRIVQDYQFGLFVVRMFGAVL